MNVAVALPLMALTACTVTVSPLHRQAATHQEHPVTHHRASQRVEIAPVVSPVPAQVHEDYKPIYDKLTPSPTPQ